MNQRRAENVGGLSDTSNMRSITVALRRDARVLAPGFPGSAKRLNAAADELDRLRANEAYNEHSAEWWERQVSSLRAVIEHAPHDAGCATPAEQLLGVPRDPSRECICWKKDAL